MSVCSKTQRNQFLLHKNTPNVTVLFILAFNFRSRVWVFVFLLLVWSLLQLVAGGRRTVLSCSMRPLVSESKQRDATDYIYRTSSAGCRVRTAQRASLPDFFDVLFFESKRRIESTTVRHSLKPTSSSNLFHERGSKQFLPRI